MAGAANESAERHRACDPAALTLRGALPLLATCDLAVGAAAIATQHGLPLYGFAAVDMIRARAKVDVRLWVDARNELSCVISMCEN